MKIEKKAIIIIIIIKIMIIIVIVKLIITLEKELKSPNWCYINSSNTKLYECVN